MVDMTSDTQVLDAIDRQTNFRISFMEVFQFDPGNAPYNSDNQALNRCFCLLRITYNGLSGWGECLFSCPCKHLDLVKWASPFEKLKGLSVQDAIAYLDTNKLNLGKERFQLVEHALNQLTNKLVNSLLPETVMTEYDLMNEETLIQRAQSYYAII
jgi:hypothetical protein